MLGFINELLASKSVIVVQSAIGVILVIVLLAIFVVKTSRDERGRAIIGTASIYSTIYFIIITSVIAQNILRLDNSFMGFVNIIQFIFNSVIAVEVIVILILKRVR
jgi:hypothetical protein